MWKAPFNVFDPHLQLPFGTELLFNLTKKGRDLAAVLTCKHEMAKCSPGMFEHARPVISSGAGGA